MLDIDTKRRIDTARDILVGKVPDPKSQVEQITIALIYKFMDDMDQQSISMGGKASFFTGEYAKYSWSNIFNPRLGGFEMLALYADAITTMSLNPNLPQLFRDIFKNAFLPYRDPETLKLFLKTINEFTYEHSERLGDAFEYLLSVLGSQGDAGQFRTPRHIIDFMVQVVKPQKHETILDPACGTAGFLISAFKYILECNKKKYPGDLLNPDERKKLLNNFKGYDISPDMGRLSRVNMFLHGFQQPQIYEYDTLTNEERWNEYADVILANPPFMSPKGGIRPHKRFSVQSTRSEVLFVDYMAEHLTPTGRAAIIVPEGIIFQSGNAYKNLRKYLIEKNILWAVVSLPVGVFNPYAGVKTSILFLDKALAKKTDQILFVKVHADGYELGAQRRPIEQNDLPNAFRVLEYWQRVIREPNLTDNNVVSNFENTLLISVSRLAQDNEYNLSADRYLKPINYVENITWPIEQLSSMAVIKKGSSITKEDIVDGSIPVIAGGQQPAYFNNIANRSGNIITISSSGAYAGFINYFPYPIFASDCTTIQSVDETKLNTFFLYLILRNKQNYFYSLQKGMGQPHVYSKDFSNFRIPIPPIEVQRQIIDEVGDYQRIINGALQIVKEWKPVIFIEPNWPIVPLGDIADFKNGVNFTKQSNGKAIKIIGVRHFQDNLIAPIEEADDILTENNLSDGFFLQEGDILFVRSNGNKELVGRSIIIPAIKEKITFSGFSIRCRLNNLANPLFYAYLFKTENYRKLLKKVGEGANINNLSQDILRGIQVVLPPISAQQKIVEDLEAERQIIQSNRELIHIYEKKIQQVINRVWEK